MTALGSPMQPVATSAPRRPYGIRASFGVTLRSARIAADPDPLVPRLLMAI
jgi:hypothetical protein